jgi:hypothetical protein
MERQADGGFGNAKQTQLCTTLQPIGLRKVRRNQLRFAHASKLGLEDVSKCVDAPIPLRPRQDLDQGRE